MHSRKKQRHCPERGRNIAVLNTSQSVCLEPGDSLEDGAGEEGKHQGMTEGFFSHQSVLYFTLMVTGSFMRWSNLFDLVPNWIWRVGTDGSSRGDMMRA